MKNNKEEYHLLVSKGANANQSIHKLLAEGVDDIYVLSNDRLKMINFVSILLCNDVTDTKNKSTDEKQASIENSMNFVAASIVSNDISPEILTLVNSCTKVMTEVITEIPSLKNLLKTVLNNKNGYIYTHSMLSAYVAAHIVKSVPWGGAIHIEKINFVLFFHDITLGPIYEKYPDFKMEEDLLFSGLLSEEEKELVINHARLSAELVSGLKRCPIGADLLIRQHHGVGNGSGFAAEFRDDISPLSKIIIVSEAFIDELFSKRNLGESVVISDIIKELKDRFSKHTYKKIIDTLNTLKI
jgi:response regulator RpfG family c-di-GMP phosphodiesterase